MHILSASLPFCPRVSRTGQAEPMVFTIMCVPPFFVVGKALRRGCYQTEESAQSGAEAKFRIVIPNSGPTEGLNARKELPRNIIRTLVKRLAGCLAAAVILPSILPF